MSTGIADERISLKIYFSLFPQKYKYTEFNKHDTINDVISFKIPPKAIQ